MGLFAISDKAPYGKVLKEFGYCGLGFLPSDTTIITDYYLCKDAYISPLSPVLASSLFGNRGLR